MHKRIMRNWILRDVIFRAAINRFKYMADQTFSRSTLYNTIEYSNNIADPNADINVFIDDSEIAVPNVFGFSFQNALNKNNKSGSNYMHQTTEGQALYNNYASYGVPIRYPSGTGSWGHTGDISFVGQGYKKYRDSGVMGPGTYTNSVEEDFYFNTLDETQDFNWESEWHSNIAGGAVSTRNGHHSYVVNYHQDWNGSSYDTTEIAAALATGNYARVEYGNEYNGPAYRDCFPSASDYTQGGYGWDGASYVVQNRNFGRARYAQISALAPSIKHAWTAPPPLWIAYENAGVPLSATLQFNKDFTLNLVDEHNNQNIRVDELVHHIYNQVSDPSVNPRGTGTITSVIKNYVPKQDVSQGYNLAFHGIQSDYVEFIWRQYISAYEDLFDHRVDHVITEWSMADQKEGLVDTMLSGMNIMKYLLAYNKINLMTQGRIAGAYYQKLSAPPRSGAVGDRRYAQGAFIKAMPGNIYGATDYQATIDLEAFKLFSPIMDGGKYLGSQKFIAAGTPNNLTSELVTIEFFESSGGDRYMFYANTSDTDYTVNWSGENVYWQGSSSGMGADAAANEWASGSYDDGVSGYPLASQTTALADNTLRARTFGRIAI